MADEKEVEYATEETYRQQLRIKHSRPLADCPSANTFWIKGDKLEKKDDG